MTAIRIAVLCLACLFRVASAQDTSPYNGVWNAGGPNLLDARVVILNGAGTWKVFDKGGATRLDPCLKAERPIVVQRSTGTELVFTVMGSAVLKGCADFPVFLKRTESGTLKGPFLQSTITLTKQE